MSREDRMPGSERDVLREVWQEQEIRARIPEIFQ